MLRKIKAALIDPGALIRYRNDKLWHVLMYLLFFSVLMGTRTLVEDVIVYDGVSFATRDAITESAVPPPTPCAIRDAVLNCDLESPHVFFTYQYFTVVLAPTNQSVTTDSQLGMNIIIQGDSVSLQMFGRTFMREPIHQFDAAIHNLDFDYADDERAFFTAFFRGVDSALMTTRPIWGTSLVISSIFSAFFLFNVFVWLNTFLTRVRLREVPLRQMFTMMTYAATLLYVVMIFETLLPIPFLLFIVLLFVAFRQMNRLAVEIYRRLHRQ